MNSDPAASLRLTLKTFLRDVSTFWGIPNLQHVGNVQRFLRKEAPAPQLSLNWNFHSAVGPKFCFISVCRAARLQWSVSAVRMEAESMPNVFMGFTVLTWILVGFWLCFNGLTFMFYVWLNSFSFKRFQNLVVFGPNACLFYPFFSPRFT